MEERDWRVREEAEAAQVISPLMFISFDFHIRISHFIFFFDVLTVK